MKYTVDTNILPIKEEEYKVSCYIKDGIDELINITMYAGTKEQAKKIAKEETEANKPQNRDETDFSRSDQSNMVKQLFDGKYLE